MPGAADVADMLSGATAKRNKSQMSMTDLAQALLRQDGEEVSLAGKDDEIISQAELDSLLDRSVRAC